MTSHAPRTCCTTGVRHEGAPKGELKTLGGVETYIAENASKDHSTAIVIYTDVIGHKLPNAQLLADQFAENGYYVVMPDLFGGDPIPMNSVMGQFNFQEWFTQGRGGKGHGPDQVTPIVEAVVKELKESHGVKKLGAVGYCFGAKYVVRGLAAGKGIDVGYSAHPSFVEADELKQITGPYSIAAAQTDNIFPQEKRIETEKILNELGATYQINLYSQVSHGFAVRGDMTKPEVKYAKEAAFVQAVGWFDEFLKGERSWAA